LCIGGTKWTPELLNHSWANKVRQKGGYSKRKKIKELTNGELAEPG
jgi:hypothetical protein